MTKPNKNSTWIIAITVALVTALMVTTVALASSYTSTLSFNSSLTGQARYYDGNAITISITAKCPTCARPAIADQRYRVTLQKQSCGWFSCSWTDKATYYFPVNGYNSATWGGVGSGTYRFYFYKVASDRANITSSDVKMSSK